ncbi:tyrosine-type recombinase/integrase [uncultured Trichococcus sp.]|uniref:tyrosine-type recombinase/integrase n=1 Tax=uncultured Trichococcus sp. TaxID=189665 RepID=UPI002A18C168|nr:tyrosine-type recombinase/integrase [uncultured Trichococcus sp.]
MEDAINLDWTAMKVRPMDVSVDSQMPLDEAKKILALYSNSSSFEDGKWLIDKVNTDKNEAKNKMNIYFGDLVSSVLIDEVKLWAIKLLASRFASRSISQKMSYLRELTKHCTGSNIYSFSDITEIEIAQFYSSLFNKSDIGVKRRLENWHNVEKFFKEMHFVEQYNMMMKFTVPKYPDHKKIDGKYIPDKIANQLDIFFKRFDIPLAYRTIYWLTRLIPNRISEVCSMTTKCLKQISESTYILSIPTFKQAGPYAKGTIKLIEIQYAGIGKYLIDLIIAQREFALQHPDEHDFLFVSNQYKYSKGQYSVQSKIVNPINSGRFAGFMQNLCKKQKFFNNDEHAVSVTTHQFRHNAISDRMNSGIFRAIDILPLTGHHNTKMVEETYTHTSKSDLKKDEPIVFRGKVVNTSNAKVLNQLLSRPYAHRIYKLGICSDDRNCSKDKSKCLSCEYLLPNVDDLDYHQHELEVWKKKKATAENIGNVSYSELCEDWIIGYETIINRILRALSDETISLPIIP